MIISFAIKFIMPLIPQNPMEFLQQEKNLKFLADFLHEIYHSIMRSRGEKSPFEQFQSLMTECKANQEKRNALLLTLMCYALRPQLIKYVVSTTLVKKNNSEKATELIYALSKFFPNYITHEKEQIIPHSNSNQ